MNLCQYIFANRGVRMSAGKLAAQVAHASVLSYVGSDPELSHKWLDSGSYTKVILLAEDERQINNISDYLHDRHIDNWMVIDEGRTEVKPFTKTALGVEIVDKDDQNINSIFSEFRLYSDLSRTISTMNHLNININV